jgi:hypothetical protein
MLVQFNKANKFTFENSFELNQEWEAFAGSYHNVSIVSTLKTNHNSMNQEDRIPKIKKQKIKITWAKCKWVNR